MLRQLLLASLHAFGAQAFAPVLIQWGSPIDESYVLAPRAFPKQMLLPERLEIMARPYKASPDAIPYFSPQLDKTIAWDAKAWCIESGGDSDGDAVYVNRCDGGPTQKWDFLPMGHGKNHRIQLQGTHKCLNVFVDRSEGGSRKVPVGLRECEDTETETWMFEDSLFGTSASPSSVRWIQNEIALATLAAIGTLGLGALFWRWQKRMRAVSRNQVCTPLSVDHGGDWMDVTLPRQQGSLLVTPNFNMGVQSQVPAAMALSPSPAAKNAHGHRFAGWQRSPFAPRGRRHVSVQMAVDTPQAPGWEKLSTLIDKEVQDRDLQLYEVGRRGLREAIDGPASAQAEYRLFGTDKSKVRVTFYRDNHAWCPYCHKVWMQLEEKQIPYRVEKVSMNCYGSKSLSFLMKTPQGLLPAIEIDGQFHTESAVIMDLIENNFPDSKPMTPEGTREMLRLERNLFGAWLAWLRADGSAQRSFEQAMDETDQALKTSGGPYFLGNDISLADCVFASSLERIAATILYYKGLDIKGGRWPHVVVWFRELEKRDSYLASRSDYHTHVHDLPPQIGGCIASRTPQQKAIAAQIDGTDGHSWNLPLPPLSQDSLEPGQENPLLDRIEAANALARCHEGVLASSKAGVGSAADEAFQVVVQALVEGVDQFQQTSKALNQGDIGPSAATALRRTRDRICVPRDMSFAAARQLRAHLNWAADIIDPQPNWAGIPLPTWNRRDMDPAAFGSNAGGGLDLYLVAVFLGAFNLGFLVFKVFF